MMLKSLPGQDGRGEYDFCQFQNKKYFTFMMINVLLILALFAVLFEVATTFLHADFEQFFGSITRKSSNKKHRLDDQ